MASAEVNASQDDVDSSMAPQLLLTATQTGTQTQVPAGPEGLCYFLSRREQILGYCVLAETRRTPPGSGSPRSLSRQGGYKVQKGEAIDMGHSPRSPDPEPVC